MPNRLLKLPLSASWDEGLPLGNGRLGGIFYGGDQLRLALDKSDLWDLTPFPESRENGFNYPHLIELIRQQSEPAFRESCRLFDECYLHTTPTKIKPGRLLLSFPIDPQTTPCLSLGDGLLTYRGIGNSLRLFFSQITGCFIFSFAKACRLTFEAAPCLFSGKDSLQYPPMRSQQEGPLEIDEVFGKDGQRVFTLFLLRKGRLVFGDIVSGREGIEAYQSRRKNLFSVARRSFADLYAEQKAWWDSYSQESVVSLPEESYQREYDINEYLLASTSKRGCPPMALQGVWTADDGGLPPWKGDYHQDLNSEGCYASALKGNHLNAFSSWTDWLWERKKTFEDVARTFYRVPGLIVPGVCDAMGNPLGGWPMYALSPTMGLWALKSFADYFDATGDEAFLRERAYPMLKEAGEATRSLLEEKDGHYYLPLSSSPEIHNNSLASYLTPISNCDLALLHWLFATLFRFSALVGEDGTPYSLILSKLPSYYRDRDGSLMLDAHENISETHRHFSHLMAIYPLKEYSLTHPEEKLSMLASLRRIESLGTAEWAGFSFPYEALLAERMDETELAKKRLDQFLDGFLSCNGFHLNGDYRQKGYSSFSYRPFTLEGNFLFQSAVEEMLLQERDDAVYLFPNVPSSWGEVSFDHLRTQGGLLLSAEYRKGELVRAEAMAPREAQQIFVYPKAGKRVRISLSLHPGANSLV